MGENDNRFYAYEMSPPLDMPLTAAPRERAWMTQWHGEASPYRCLPMVLANQAGWLILNSTSFTAIWDGGAHQSSLQLHFGPAPAGQPSYDGGFGFGVVEVASAYRPSAPPARSVRHISSLFGGGIVTFNVPYLFRTPPGINLWIKGPSNWIRDGAQALEAIVEADWMVASFTMNWKLTRPHYPVRFERGEPICMVMPLPRGLAEGLEPITLPLASQPDLEREYLTWQQKRNEFNAALKQHDPEAVRAGWQRDYQKGVTAEGTAAPEHQTRLRLKEFTRPEEPPQ
jgi:hypothetical protein